MVTTGRSKIGKKQELAIAFLLTEKNSDDAAAKAGISSSTLKRWMRLEDFQRAFRDARHQAFTDAIARLQGASSLAVAKLIERLSSQKDGDEIKAAALLLDHAFRARELGEIEARLSELEALLNDLRQKNEQQNETR